MELNEWIRVSNIRFGLCVFEFASESGFWKRDLEEGIGGGMLDVRIRCEN